MSVTQGQTWDAGSSVADATVTTAFQSDTYATLNGGSKNGRAFKAVNFDVASASAAALKVNIPFLHGPTFYYTIPVGTSKEFITVCDGPSHIAKGDVIKVQGAGGIATFSGGITA